MKLLRARPHFVLSVQPRLERQKENRNETENRTFSGQCSLTPPFLPLPPLELGRFLVIVCAFSFYTLSSEWMKVFCACCCRQSVAGRGRGKGRRERERKSRWMGERCDFPFVSLFRDKKSRLLLTPPPPSFGGQFEDSARSATSLFFASFTP